MNRLCCVSMKNTCTIGTCSLRKSFFHESSMSCIRADAIKKGIVSPMLPLPLSVKCPEYARSGVPVPSSHIFRTFNDTEVQKIRKAGKLARRMLEYANSLVRPGVSTDEIDRLTHHEILRNGAYPTPLNYSGFPKSICTSVNEVVCHGIPDNTVLQEGDIISIDVSLYTEDGFHGDNCGSVVVGNSNALMNKLIDTTKYAVEKAIEVCGPDQCISSIGKVIESIADSKGYSVVHEFCGHGVGSYIHMKPLILHFKNNEPFRMVPGMVFTIEPILVEGSRRICQWEDGWTASTIDGGWGAQIEHMVLITKNGVEVLTTLD